MAEAISKRGNIFTGKVISDKMNKTVIVLRELTQFIAKYERYKKVKSKIAAHNPPEINARIGDVVNIAETRRLSKTKSFIVTEIVKREEQ
jgi:small subunit ribosomal protein S17